MTTNQQIRILGTILLNATEETKENKKFLSNMRKLQFLAQEEELGRVLGQEWIDWNNNRKAAAKAAVKAFRNAKLAA